MRPGAAVGGLADLGEQPDDERRQQPLLVAAAAM
jgi:hypothetical protein